MLPSLQSESLLLGGCACLAVTQFSLPVQALGVTPSNDAAALAAALIGPGVSLVPGSAVYTGATLASGFFTGDTTIFGEPTGVEGVILTSGEATNALPPNNSGGKSSSNGAPGSAFLSGLIGGATTNNASTLEFKIKVDPGTSGLEWTYVFASEEYNEFVNSSFNDVFALALNGTNLSLIPGTSTPVSINNVNNGNPFGSGTISNPAFYRNNSPGSFDTQYDGLTTVLKSTASGLLPDVEYMLTFAIADAGDSALDSGVFILGDSVKDPDIPPGPGPGPGPDPGPQPVAAPSPLAIAGLPIVLGSIRKLRKFSTALQRYSL